MVANNRPNKNIDDELEKCACGKAPKMRVSLGGATAYYGIYCDCGKNNRHYDSAIACMGVGIGNFPPMDREQAINDWNAIHSMIAGTGPARAIDYEHP